MRQFISKNFGEHAGAGAAALAVHIMVAVWIMPSAAAPVSVTQQVIQARLVAPSAVAPEPPQQTAAEVPVRAAPIAPKPEAVKIQERPKPVRKKQTAQPMQKPDDAPRQALNNPTSGPQAENATAEASARSEPVFDAAYLQNPPPVYPASAQRKGIQGAVTLEVTVTAAGDARNIMVARSSGWTALDDAARHAIARWRFIPARRGHEVVEAKVLVPVEFKLRERRS